VRFAPPSASCLYMRPRTAVLSLLPLFLLLIAVRSTAEAGPRDGAPSSADSASSVDETEEPDTADVNAEAAPAPEPRLHIHRRSGLPPPDEGSMRAWHRRYAEASAPVKAALGELLAARRRHQRPAKWRAHCERLAAAMEAFWKEAPRRRVLPVADAAADVHLKRLYLRLDDVAQTCVDGRWAETEDHLRRAGLAFRQAELALGRWEVEP
jgi:hypothetical protein